MADKWRYYEGTTSSKTILKDIAKVLCAAVKDDDKAVIQERNWDVVFPGIDTNPIEQDYIAPVDKRNLTNEEFDYKIKNQLRQIKNKVILKTTTTPVETDGNVVDDLGIESDLNKKSITMYVEFYKSDYLYDPEAYEPETEINGLLPLLKTYDYEKYDADNGEETPYEEKLCRNNHYICVRAFDEIEYKYENTRIVDATPKEEIKDEYTGNILETKSHISEWAKLAWYKDFEEVERDLHDSDIGGEDISDGVEFVPCITPGINGDTRIRFWINTNNDRATMVVMGNPSLEYSSAKHMTSFAYFGKIKSFDNSINDTAGNFAITCSSSTIPCKTVQKILKTTFTDVLAAESLIDDIGVGDGMKNRFFVKFKNSYRPGTLDVLLDGSVVNKALYRLDCDLLEFVHPPKQGEKISVRASFIVPEVDTRRGITRDEFGNIINIVQPNKYGQNTASCVTDIGMYHTRSKAYWQKHLVMFNTTEEYMTKEMYGKSAYTDEYYADKIKVTHGNDGPRGILDACLVIDQSSLIPLDDLVINRDFEKDPNKPEETYVYFPITAAYSLLSTGPNALSGIAILKSVKYPAPKTDEEAVDRVIENLYIGKTNAIIADFKVPQSAQYDSMPKPATIEWVSSDKASIDVETEKGLAKVTRPEQEKEAAHLTLTASITVGDCTKNVIFNCVVFPQGLSDTQAVAKDKLWIHVDGLDAVKTDIILPAEGPNETIITWASNNEDVIKPTVL